MHIDYRKTYTACRALLRAGGFWRREDGAMTILGLMLLMGMVAIVGIGVDIMRYERDRVHLQNTLDRAVLAAADLDQQLSPTQVVEDYFAKAGLSDSLTNVTPFSDVGSREVSARADMDVDTFFMQMFGVETLQIANVSAARESIDSVEISLVLDVSGSMGSHSRLTNLKVAGREFIDNMFDNSVEDTVTISVVPYATQVTIPEELMDRLNAKFVPTEGLIGTLTEDELAAVDNEELAAAQHARATGDYLPDRDRSLSNCINFESSDFNNTIISTTEEYQRTLHFDPWTRFDGRDNDPEDLVPIPVCHTDASREMVILSDDRTELKDFIDSFYASGNTSLDLGMKWGTILLDPSFRPIVEELADPDVGLIDPKYSNRPVNHSDSETIKVVVLMTDGQNTSQYFINDDYRIGDSNIWWNEEAEIYSVYLGEDENDDNGNGETDDGLYYWPFNDTYQDHPFSAGNSYEETDTIYECRSFRRNGSCRKYKKITVTNTFEGYGTAELLTYPELWAWTSMQQVVRRLYEPFMNNSQAWNDWYFAVRNSVDSATKNTRTRAICDAAKDNNTIVYTIAFEAPSGVKPLLQDCASSPAYAFDVDGLEISDAFAAIASSIRQLRLTQ